MGVQELSKEEIEKLCEEIRVLVLKYHLAMCSSNKTATLMAAKKIVYWVIHELYPDDAPIYRVSKAMLEHAAHTN